MLSSKADMAECNRKTER
jgi:uncharacterized protein